MPTTVRCTVALSLVALAAVLLGPDALHHAWARVPLDGWSGVHLASTALLARWFPEEFWFLVVGWEVVEQVLVPRLVPECAHRFHESWEDTLGDLLVACLVAPACALRPR